MIVLKLKYYFITDKGTLKIGDPIYIFRSMARKPS